MAMAIAIAIAIAVAVTIVNTITITYLQCLQQCLQYIERTKHARGEREPLNKALRFPNRKHHDLSLIHI